MEGCLEQINSPSEEIPAARVDGEEIGDIPGLQ